CSEENKTLFAAQQLRGSARLWWDNYHGMLPADHVVTWNEFKNAFRDHHIPEGLMERKLNEFLALTQGTRTVIQYAQAFNGLCQYAGYHADTDVKKRDRFRRGLNTKLKERLNPIRVDTYNTTSWLISHSLKKTVSWLTVLRKRGKRQLDPLVRSHKGIV